MAGRIYGFCGRRPLPSAAARFRSSPVRASRSCRFAPRNLPRREFRLLAVRQAVRLDFACGVHRARAGSAFRGAVSVTNASSSEENTALTSRMIMNSSTRLPIPCMKSVRHRMASSIDNRRDPSAAHDRPVRTRHPVNHHSDTVVFMADGNHLLNRRRRAWRMRRVSQVAVWNEASAHRANRGGFHRHCSDSRRAYQDTALFVSLHAGLSSIGLSGQLRQCGFPSSAEGMHRG
jgi:hypothetical protein